jgi:hypothetical protein
LQVMHTVTRLLQRCESYWMLTLAIVRLNKHCDYGSLDGSQSGTVETLTQRIYELERILAFRSASSPDSPYSGGSSSSSGMPLPRETGLLPLFFLDSDLFNHQFLSIQVPQVFTPQIISEILGSKADMLRTSQVYFDTVHMWMPMISKTRFRQNMTSSSADMPSDLAALNLCMKLIIDQEFEHLDPQSTHLYHSAKQFYRNLESSSHLTLAMLQALILIAMYELGHGIYPVCARTNLYGYVANEIHRRHIYQ